jgi:competence protein ComEA
MSMSKAKFKRVCGVVARVKQAIEGSAWAPLAGRGAAYLIGFALLALVGSGRMARWMSPAPTLGIAVAEAATAPLPPSPPSSATAASVTAVEEVASPVADAGASPADAGAASGGVAADGKVILNLATEEDLRRLPGIGRGRAQAILALRGRLKKFSRVEDLLKVKGVGRRGLTRLRPLVRVD